MQKYRNMSNEEIIKSLKKYGLSHGPVVGSTRTLYEKKLLEFESERTTLPSSANSSPESREQYSKRHFDDEDDSSYTSREQYSRRNYDDDNGDNETYEEEVYTRTSRYPEVYQRPDLQNKSYSSPGSMYQNISQVRHQSSYSQGVEPRKPIRPKKKEEEEEKPVKRFLPLWLQLFLFVLFAGFLVYLYLCQADDNPFRAIGLDL
ncbi:emerin [Pseudophryne corroboree]|uniref:emerin n=1 Tax=Pseudophryne corroboree TaxID=495146 RepID=UPI0030818512